jgi:hypothetical protein
MTTAMTRARMAMVRVFTCPPVVVRRGDQPHRRPVGRSLATRSANARLQRTTVTPALSISATALCPSPGCSSTKRVAASGRTTS